MLWRWPNEAMDEVRREETRTQPQSIKAALGTNERKLLKSLAWGMRRNPDGWSSKQTHAMHWLQHSTLKSARAWRLKMALRTVYANATQHNDEDLARAELSSWLSWATRCRLEPFKKLALTLKQRLDGVVRGMLDNRSNAYVEAMNGLLQQAKRAARGFKTASNFIAIAYLRMSKLKHLPSNPLEPAVSPKYEQTANALGRKFKIRHELSPDGQMAQLLELVQWPDAKGTVLVVGHQPTLGQTIARLIELKSPECAVKKGSVWWLRHRQRETLTHSVLVAVQSPELL